MSSLYSPLSILYRSFKYSPIFLYHSCGSNISVDTHHEDSMSVSHEFLCFDESQSQRLGRISLPALCRNNPVSDMSSKIGEIFTRGNLMADIHRTDNRLVPHDEKKRSPNLSWGRIRLIGFSYSQKIAIRISSKKGRWARRNRLM